MKAGTNGRWIVTTVIAVAALVVSGYTAYVTWQNNINAKAALEETKRQFEAAGPRFSAEATVDIWNTEEGSWASSEPAGTSLAFERMQPPNDLYVTLYVTNIGRSRGSVDEVGIMKDETMRVASSNPRCDGPDFLVTISCLFPSVLEPEARAKFYILIDETMRNALTCNQFAESRGIVAYAKFISGAEVNVPTQVSIAYSSYCPDLPGSSNGAG